MIDRENAQTAGFTLFGVAVCVAAVFVVQSCSHMINNSNEIELKTKQACISAGGSVFTDRSGKINCIAGSSGK
jgi:hypothetical protein